LCAQSFLGTGSGKRKDLLTEREPLGTRKNPPRGNMLQGRRGMTAKNFLYYEKFDQGEGGDSCAYDFWNGGEKFAKTHVLLTKKEEGE